MFRNYSVSSSHHPNFWHVRYDGSNTIKAVVSTSLGQTKIPQILTVCQNASRIQRSSNRWFPEDPLQFPFHLLLINAALIIFITRLLRFLLKPLKQPRVVSEIIGGIIMGPSGLGRSKKFCDYLLPTNIKFVISNIGLMGFMLFLFLIGVKMDISLVQKATKKHWIIAFLGMAIPFLAVIVVASVIRSSLDEQLAKSSSIVGIAASMAVTGYFVLYPVLQELNLLSSEIGRMALSCLIIVDLTGIILFVTFEVLTQVDVNPNAGKWCMISTIAFICLNFILRRGMMFIVEKTPQGKPVKQTYVIQLLVGVFFMGFLADLLGIGLVNGSLWFGLAVPDGPPLGSTIVEKSETLINEFFMPFSYVFVGMFVDVSAMTNADWSSLAPLFAIILAGYISKMLSTLGASLLIEMPHKDGLALSLIMSLRGQLELVLIMHWMDKRMLQIPSFTMLVLLTAAVTATMTPFITSLYDPMTPYMINNRRTIQHTLPNTDLVVVACIPERDGDASLINLFECSYPSSKCPYSVYSLQLIELTGRAAPMFIDHEKAKKNSKHHPKYELAHKAMKLFQESKSEFMKLQAFTIVAPKRTMYQDICELALANEAALIILPFHKEWLHPANDKPVEYNSQLSVISSVLGHAPCSVGILVHKGQFQNPLFANPFKNHTHNFIMLFLGGADAREALAYADRIAMNPEVFLTIVWFLPQNHEDEDSIEKKLDDDAMVLFQERNERYKRVAYKKVVVSNGEETLEAIQGLNDRQYDLWIMGRKQGINPILVTGLTNSCNYQELGVIGDFVSSEDFDCTASVLVVQQQVLRSERINYKS